MKHCKRIWSALLVIALLGAVFAGCGDSTTPSGDSTTPSTDAGTTGSGDGEAGEPASGGSSFDERVTLYVTAFVSRGEADGRRSDPVSLLVEEALNIDLELTGTIESEYPTQLSAMIAANDMPDIFLFSDVTKQYPMLMASNSLLNLEPYLEEYAPNTTSDPNGQVMLEAYRTSANSPDGNAYMWGMSKGSWDDGTVPTCGHYIRWDLYKEAGYPALNSYDDLLDALEMMVELEPETADGQRTYGMGAWFGDGQDWGEWVFTYGMGPQEGANLVLTAARTLAISTVDSTPKAENQMTDPGSHFWRAMEFFNKANQRGLLDPDSFTQTSDVYEDRLKSGRYMFNIPGWMSVSANQEFGKTEDNLKTFVSLPSINSDAEDRFGNMYKGERTYGVSANTQYPERCVALLDYLSTYEFSILAWNGIEGINWNTEDGVPTPTDEYLAATKDEEFGLSTGANVYHHFSGYGNGSVDPDTGAFVDLYQFSDKANELKLNDTLRDFISHYGQSSHVDVYRAETATTTAINLTNYGEPPQELKTYVNNLDAYMGTRFARLVACESDAEFQQMRDEMIQEMIDEYHAEEIFEHFYNETLEQADEIAKLASMIQEANS